MSVDDRTRWNQRYRQGDAPVESQPNRWLAAQVDHLDRVAAARQCMAARPSALDLACGAGGTVIWLAQRGWEATGVDVSDAALALAAAAAAQHAGVGHAHFLHVDLDDWHPPVSAFDCVTCFYFLDRRLWPWLRAAVRPGGLLAMQSHHQGVRKLRPHANPAYLLAPGELTALIAAWGWTLLAVRDGTAASTSEAILAQRPAEACEAANQ